ncbi:hypothetical protein Glo7428_3145 [Gloeocapsa sp. PCC 7428]|uniref:hypothetical protein n=1 Tax=Gloeocapsa sp. PCC 7428 TaxID=1173026 RepID=UPI0002A61D56|nr:hypothetical protein [Gloeocapsa sp. PCC 7428]AFZ31632.1 hypothetical protein Glo7428_3145 [Gloeocapsa sp. PCC 7428]
MDFDFEYLKIPVFTGINDNPVEPTETKAGNGSHLIQVINNLVDETVDGLNNLQYGLEHLLPPINNWKLISTEVIDYYAQPGEKIVIISTGIDQNVNVYLPSNPPEGTEISLIKTSDSDTVQIQYNGKFCNDYPSQLFLADRYRLATVIWTGDSFGWIPNVRNYGIEEVYSAS